jgi:hypothetical protein
MKKTAVELDSCLKCTAVRQGPRQLIGQLVPGLTSTSRLHVYEIVSALSAMHRSTGVAGRVGSGGHNIADVKQLWIAIGALKRTERAKEASRFEL